MTCPCLTCPNWKAWCEGTINATVSYHRDGGTEAQRLVGRTDDAPGKWERETQDETARTEREIEREE